jgi:restriction system protein
MPEITRRRLGEMLRKLFEILAKHPEGLQAHKALETLAGSLTLTPHEAGNYPSGGRRFEKIVRFATIPAVKAGWLIKSKGLWLVTSDGKTAHTKHREPEAFYREAKRLYTQWKASRADDETGDDIGDDLDDVPAKHSSITYEEAEEQAWAEIESYLASMNPYEFQELVAALLRGMGYHVSWVAPPGKDGGIDILAWSDPLGTRPPRIKVQVKRQKESVSQGGLRSFMAVLGDDDVGLFVSTGGFTRDAQEEARTQEKRRVTLVDLEKLVQLWTEHYGKLDDAARRRLPLQAIWFLAPQP